MSGGDVVAVAAGRVAAGQGAAEREAGGCTDSAQAGQLAAAQPTEESGWRRVGGPRFSHLSELVILWLCSRWG
ncbi:hypothetical protein [Streptomyces atroolivaceus]|uniref:Uncharacterized protein n=1 Tax=Streptomyces atroolivaceus TaxID=66869 RepID=A0ABV9VLU7_STRAZ|nr:hypothetical protein [Streptomyces atroolivaceus]